MVAPRHPDPAAWHGLLSGDVDPAERSVLEAHLAACKDCQLTHDRVRRTKSLFSHIGAHEGIDEVAWQRLAGRVRTELESKAEDRLRGQAGRGRAWAWIGGGVVGIAAVSAALLLWLRPATPPPVVAEDDRRPPAAPTAATLSAGDTPLEVALPKGPKLRLERQSKLKLRNEGPHVRLDIESGELSVAAPEAPESTGEVRVRAPGLVAVARSSDFSIGYRGSQAYVDVRHGEVRVSGSSLEGVEVLRDGENLRVRKSDSNDVVQRGRAPEDDASVWRDARSAFDAGDLHRAAVLAEKVLEGNPTASDRQLASRMACQARQAGTDHAATIRACRLLIDDPISARMANLAIGRAELALSHVGPAEIAFASVLRTTGPSAETFEARFGLAKCAFLRGDLASAQARLAEAGEPTSGFEQEFRKLESAVKSGAKSP